MHDIVDVGPVEEVLVVSDLETGLATLEDGEETWHSLTVTGAAVMNEKSAGNSYGGKQDQIANAPKDTGRTNRHSQKVARAIRSEDDLLCLGLKSTGVLVTSEVQRA